MMSETGNQSVQRPQPSEISSTVRGNVVPVYPAKTTKIVGNRPVKDNKAEDTDQLMGYLD